MPRKGGNGGNKSNKKNSVANVDIISSRTGENKALAGDTDETSLKTTSSTSSSTTTKILKKATVRKKGTPSLSTFYPSSSFITSPIYLMGYNLILFYFILTFLQRAYTIRLSAIETYGPIIHEFDPWFNFRATVYLRENGREKFFTWFDYQSWYPLGRPVGTTIYPGLQFTACGIKIFLDSCLGNASNNYEYMSLNDICCYMPAWFGSLTPLILGLWGYEASTSSMSAVNYDQHPHVEVGIFSLILMSVIPAGLMRTIGGAFDNECIAITAMTCTFYLWCKSLSTSGSFNNSYGCYFYGILSGISYGYMVAAWGGYVFVLNMVGIHAASLIALGRFDKRIYVAYTAFYGVGTFLAMQIPVVGWTPLKSLEQLGPAFVFCIYQVLIIANILLKRYQKQQQHNQKQNSSILKQGIIVHTACFFVAILIACALAYLAPTGYFGPISSRVRGLFVRHTKTGNPLVDSVAEHQPSTSRSYQAFLKSCSILAPMGFSYILFICGTSSVFSSDISIQSAMFRFFLLKHVSNTNLFLLLYAIAGYFFSKKMNRMMVLLGPIASLLSAVVLGRMWCWSLKHTLMPHADLEETKDISNKNTKEAAAGKKKSNDDDSWMDNGSKNSKQSNSRSNKGSSHNKQVSSTIPVHTLIQKSIGKSLDSSLGRTLSKIIGILYLLLLGSVTPTFLQSCSRVAQQMSNPVLVKYSKLRENNKMVLVEDYKVAYEWLRDNTPPDSRILAWWDYGYQISGISNRTTLADGNTWNHEHIALLGKILTMEEEGSHKIARHLADYALVWAGQNGDDLDKSPHLARIANSVYRDLCPADDITCRSFRFLDRERTPSPMMGKSLLYKLVQNKVKEGVVVDESRWNEVYRSKYGKVRIYKIGNVSQESKDWVSNHANRICDVEGSWYCRGQYPPALDEVLSSKTDFAQLEDFNKKGNEDTEYQKQYFESLNKQRNIKQDRVKYEGEYLTFLYNAIKVGDVNSVKNYLKQNPKAAHARSDDGRGPLFWAFEFGHSDLVEFLKVDMNVKQQKDKKGVRPVDLKTSN